MKRSQPIDISWQPDPAIDMPVYEQIARFIYDKAKSGAWPAGTRLPAQRLLAKAFHVNRSTIVASWEWLYGHGVIEGKGSRGTVIAKSAWSRIMMGDGGWRKHLSAGFFRANKHIVQTINQMEFQRDMVRLGTGELDPRLFPQDMMQEVLATVGWRMQSLGYSEPLGQRALREALRDYLRQRGIHVSPSSILITSGSLQAFQLIAMSLVEGGSVIYTEAPTYIQSLQVFQSAGLTLRGIPMDEEGLEYWHIPKRTKLPTLLYTIPTNQNPTGLTMSIERRKAVLTYCVERQLPIIEDGAYEDLYFDGTKPLSLKGMDEDGIVLYVGSASKALAPGLRIGWIVAPEPIIQRLSDVKMQVDYGASALSQLVFTEFLRTRLYDQYTVRLRLELRRRRDAAIAVLDRYYRSFATWRIPKGGFYIWLTIDGDISMKDLFQSALEAGILINPGDIYDFSPTPSLRLSYAYTTPDEFAVAARKLALLIQQQMN